MITTAEIIDGPKVRITRGDGSVVDLTHAEVLVASRMMRDALEHPVEVPSLPQHAFSCPNGRVNCFCTGGSAPGACDGPDA